MLLSSQRPALIPFHSMELRLIDGEGNWELRSNKQWLSHLQILIVTILDVAESLNIQNDCKQILGLPWWSFLYIFFSSFFFFHFGFTIFSKLAPSTCGDKQTKTGSIAKMIDSKLECTTFSWSLQYIINYVQGFRFYY